MKSPVTTTQILVAASADGVNFTAFATIADPTIRAYTATGLDPTTNYTFTVSAYNDNGDSDYSFTSTASTTDDAWETVGSVTTTDDLAGGPPPVAWFTPLPGQGDGDYFHAGLYQIRYAGGAYDYNNDPESSAPPAWYTAGYFYHAQDATGYDNQIQLPGVANRPSLEQAVHDTYAYMGSGGGGGDGFADQKIGVSGPGTDLFPGPGVTWTLERRIPHVRVYSIADSTTEGDVEESRNGDAASI
jgi:hypothetical protein